MELNLLISNKRGFFFSLIRLEFEDSCQDYYSEFDAVTITGYEHFVVEKIVGNNLNILSELFKKKLESDDDDDDDDESNRENLIFEVNNKSNENVKLIDMPVRSCFFVCLFVFKFLFFFSKKFFILF